MQKTSEVYERLYHYTTWEGLYGLLNDQCLHATHYKFTNDYSEIVLFKPKLIEFLQPYVSEELDKLQKKFSIVNKYDNRLLDAITKHYVETLYDVHCDEFYLASFCGRHEDDYINKHGLLSQWRGYGKDGGFALVFNTDNLEKILQMEHARFNQIGLLADIIYSDDEEKFKSELSAPMREIAEYIIEVFRLKNMDGSSSNAENPPPDLVQRAQMVIPAFVQCVSRYKHHGFKEEKEIRIVVWPLPRVPGAVEERQDKKRQLREMNGEYVPYIELFNSPDIVLPIERIIVGPHKNKEKRADILRLMLKNVLKKENIDVTVSDIPYI